VVHAAVELLHALDVRARGGKHRFAHGFVDIDANGTEKVSIQQFMTIPDVAIAEFRVKDFGEFVGHSFILCIDQLRGENAREEPREAMKLDGELVKFSVGQDSAVEPG
jgi:hypothetical protein